MMRLFRKDFFTTPADPAELSGNWADMLMVGGNTKHSEKARSLADMLQYVGAALAVGVLIAAVFALNHLSKEVKFEDVAAALAAVPWSAVIWSVTFTTLSYLALSGYDFIALRYLGKWLDYRHVLMASFISYSVGSVVGFQFLTGGSLRYRIYGATGLTAAEAALLTGICGITFVMTVVLVLGLALFLVPDVISTVNNLPVSINGLFGVIIISTLAGVLVWLGSGRRALTWGSWRLPLPSARLTSVQFAVGIVDMLFASAALYVLLPQEAHISYLLFTGVFVTALTIGLLSHVPGGIGVFESVMLLALPWIPADKLLASLLLFRCVYYLLPFLIAMPLFAWHEAKHSSMGGWLMTRLKSAIRRLMRLATPVPPRG